MNAPQTILTAQTLTATTNGTAVAMTIANAGSADLGSLFQVTVPVTSNKRSAGNETVSFKIQDSPDGATWTDRSVNRRIFDDGMIATTDGAGGTVTFDAILKQPANVRLVATLAGTSPSVALGACSVRPASFAIFTAKVVSGSAGAPHFDLQTGQSQLAEKVQTQYPVRPMNLAGLDALNAQQFGIVGSTWLIAFARLT